MLKFLVLSALVAVTFAKTLKHVDDGIAQWELFKIEHEKAYNSVEEEELRKNIFMENLKLINEHNTKYESGKVSYNVAINKFADMTSKEFVQTMNGLSVPEGYEMNFSERELDFDVELPKTVDWRKNGAVTPVKNQGSCGSCWAFSATGAIEGQNFLKTKKLVSLSEQNLIDCSLKEGNEGCHGGYMDSAFQYVKDNKGIDTEEAYPYEAENNKCRFSPDHVGAVITGYIDVTNGSESELQTAVAQVGPVSVGIDAGGMLFPFYKSGVYRADDCSRTHVNHALLAIGYGRLRKRGEYWLIKNSWGTSWGMNGYGMIARNDNNMCGIATLASYPKV